MQSLLARAITCLNSEEVILPSGFAIGFGTVFITRDTLENPLSSIFGSSIYGFFCSMGAGLVGNLVPLPFRFVFPLAASSFLIRRFYLFFQPRDANPPSYQ
jgi:hypothetical protein